MKFLEGRVQGRSNNYYSPEKRGLGLPKNVFATLATKVGFRETFYFYPLVKNKIV